jgi:hypothetical protein
MPEDPVIRVRVAAETLDALRTFIEETQPDLGCRPAAQRTDTGFVTDIYLPESQLTAARASRSASYVRLTVMENTTEIGRARQEEVGKGNRFSARGIVPRGLGRKE